MSYVNAQIFHTGTWAAACHWPLGSEPLAAFPARLTQQQAHHAMQRNAHPTKRKISRYSAVLGRKLEPKRHTVELAASGPELWPVFRLNSRWARRARRHRAKGPVETLGSLGQILRSAELPKGGNPRCLPDSQEQAGQQTDCRCLLSSTFPGLCSWRKWMRSEGQPRSPTVLENTPH